DVGHEVGDVGHEAGDVGHEAGDVGHEAGEASLTCVRGQVAVATTSGRVVAVRVEPPAPRACPEALEAVAAADWAVLGPGSWFTSVIPHLLVPELAKTLAATRARRLVNLNLAAQPGETEGFSAANHLEALAAHAPGLRVDVVLADPCSVGDEAAVREAAAGLGAQLVVRPVAREDGSPRHDPARLAQALGEIFERYRGAE
ncbi:MAG: gluconeogenesis factor YvcK family protein, partial [Mycobacteriales bacterium]